MCHGIWVAHYSQAVTVWPVIVHSLPVLLLAAVSPVLFLNASRALTAHGRRGGVLFAIGSALVLALLGVLAMGLMGAAASQAVERELASRAVDAALGALLIVYAGWMLRERRAGETSRRVDEATERSSPSRVHSDFFAGMLGMATNFTTLPLFMSAAQRLGTATGGWLVKVPALALAVLIVALPSWLPIVISILLPRSKGITPARERRIKRATGDISIAACLIGGLVILIRLV